MLIMQQTFKNTKEIKAAVDAGKSVKWSNDSHSVIKNEIGQYMIKDGRGTFISLTYPNGKLSGYIEDFYIKH